MSVVISAVTDWTTNMEGCSYMLSSMDLEPEAKDDGQTETPTESIDYFERDAPLGFVYVVTLAVPVSDDE